MEKLITITDLCAELGMDKANFERQILNKLNIKPFYTRGKANQKVRAFTEEVANQIREYRKDFINNKAYNNKYFLYCVEIDPYLVNRYKFGITNSLDSRLNCYKTICPNLKLLKTWEVSDNQIEQIILKELSKKYLKLGQEVYIIDDINYVFSKIENIISMFKNLM